MNRHLSEERRAANDAVLVVESGGQRYAFEMKLVAEIRGNRAVQGACNGQTHDSVQRNGVRVPVFRLGDSACAGSRGRCGAVVVLDLPDRVAAVAVDAVCEVRITHARSHPAPASTIDCLHDSVTWIAVWEGGEAPVLDAGAWLHAREAQFTEPCVA